MRAVFAMDIKVKFRNTGLRRTLIVGAQIVLLLVCVPCAIWFGSRFMQPSLDNDTYLRGLVGTAVRYPDSTEAEVLSQELRQGGPALMERIVRMAQSDDACALYLVKTYRKNLAALDFMKQMPIERETAHNILEKITAENLPALKAQAEESASAAFLMALAYDEGNLVQQDYGQAASYYDRAYVLSKKQWPQARELYANAAYECALRIEGDDAAFVSLLSSSAEAGNADAQYVLGNVCSQRGAYEEAVKWYGMSAEQNQNEAILALGMCHYQGCGVPRNEELAADLLGKAGNQGSCEAQYWAGKAYESLEKNGRMRESKEQASFLWYRAAAEGYYLKSELYNKDGKTRAAANMMIWAAKAGIRALERRKTGYGRSLMRALDSFENLYKKQEQVNSADGLAYEPILNGAWQMVDDILTELEKL